MDKISTIKQNILFFIENQQFKKEAFFKLVDISYGNFKGKSLKSEIGADQLVKILTKFPEINPAWLLTGKGEMLLTSDFLPSSNPIVAKANAVIDAQLVAALQETNVTLKENNAMLKENNATLKKELEACQDEKKILATNKSVV